MSTTIQIINRTRRVRDQRLAFALSGLQEQITQHFAPHWGVDGKLVFVGRTQQPNPKQWRLLMLDNSDEPGDLGYHEFDIGIPEAKVFVEEDIRYGSDITVTMSHELLEMLADPDAARMVTPKHGGPAYALEVCDAVEADTDGYICQGIRVSNFVLPTYYGLPSANPDPKWHNVYDYMRLLAGPVPHMLAGGYVLWSQGGVMHTTMQRHADGTLSHRATRPEGRSTRKAFMLGNGVAA